MLETPDDMTMVRAGTRTVTLVPQAGVRSRTPGSCSPGVGDVTAVARTLSPVSGLFTVTEKVMVAVAPGARLPVQVRFGLA